jgi:hypothetical protein
VNFSRTKTKHGRHILLSSGKICILLSVFALQKKTKQCLFIDPIAPPMGSADDNHMHLVQNALLQFHVPQLANYCLGLRL